MISSPVQLTYMKKFLAGLLVFIILVVYPATLLMTVLRYAVLQPETVKTLIHESQLGELLPSIIAESDESQATQPETSVPAIQAETLIESTLQPETVYTVTDQIVDAVALWINTDAPIEELDIRISTGQIKAQLLESSHGEADLSFLSDELTTQDLLKQTDNAGPEQLRNLNEQLNQLRSTIRQVFMWMWISWGIILVCLLLIILLRHRPGFVVLGWYGWTTLFMTLEVIPLVVTLWFAPQWILPWISGNNSPATMDVIERGITALFRMMMFPISMAMVATGLLAILLLVLKSVLKHHQKTSA